MLKTKLIERGIPELGPFATANDFQSVGKLIIHPQSQASKVLKHSILTLQEENLRVTRIVVNDDKNIPLASLERTREGSTVSIWSNCPGYSVITVLTEEWKVAIILS
jgi:hypothetical protein